MANDPFAVLGLSPSASEDEIKSAYRKLAKKYHPDLHPGDKAAEQKMKEINDAYTQALQIKKGGGASSPFGSNWSSGYQQNPYGRSSSSQQSYQYTYQDPGRQNASGSPFGEYGFDPFAAFFGGQQARQGASFRPRAYANPDLRTAADLILSGRHTDALQILNRITQHDADWHALYARADMALGNRISALDHAKAAVRLSPQDAEYQQLLSSIDSGRETYRQTRQDGGYDFRSMICGNPCLTCIAANMALNCCMGGFGRFFCC